MRSLVADEVSLLISKGISKLGSGLVGSSAYDTAWISWLSSMYSIPEFTGATEWLRTHQDPESGSWGSIENVDHYHDRVVSTLTAIIALRQVGKRNQGDETRIAAGIKYLWAVNSSLHKDRHDTGNFRGLMATLVEEANQLHLGVPTVWHYKNNILKANLDRIRANAAHWRTHPMMFSLETLRPTIEEDSAFVLKNGSVGISPSTTAGMLIFSGAPSHENMLSYLRQNVNPDGGVPQFAKMDIYEIAWGLNHLRLVDAISPDMPLVRHYLDYLWQHWSSELGIGVASICEVHDLDATLAVLTLLAWGGYPVTPDIIATYESDDRFRCWTGETDLSLSIHIRLLAALEYFSGHPSYETWKTKALTVVEDASQRGDLWFDKWHASPFYLVNLITQYLRTENASLVEQYVHWLEASQRWDGGWGYYASTLEETAYAVQSILLWAKSGYKIDKSVLERGIQYIQQEGGEDVPLQGPALWIGKSLFYPSLVVWLAALSALYAYSELKECL